MATYQPLETGNSDDICVNIDGEDEEGSSKSKSFSCDLRCPLEPNKSCTQCSINLLFQCRIMFNI